MQCRFVFKPRKAAQRVCHQNTEKIDVALKLSNFNQHTDSLTSERDIERLMQPAQGAVSLRDRLSKVWVLQSELTEALASLSLKIPPAQREEAEFNAVVTSGNDLKVSQVHIA